MRNGNGNSGMHNWYRTADASVDGEFERRKAFRLSFRQAGKIDRRIRPLSKRHCLIVAWLVLILAISLIMILIDQKAFWLGR